MEIQSCRTTYYYMKATQVESFRWLASSRMRGYTVEDDTGKRFPGIIVVDLDDVNVSIERELVKWNTRFSYTLDDNAAPPVTYKGSVSGQEFTRPARTGVFHGGSMLPPHTPLSDSLIEDMRKALVEEVASQAALPW